MAAAAADENNTKRMIGLLTSIQDKIDGLSLNQKAMEARLDKLHPPQHVVVGEEVEEAKK